MGVAHVVAGGELHGEQVGVGGEDAAELVAAGGGGAVLEGGEGQPHRVDGVEQRRKAMRVSFFSSLFFVSSGFLFSGSVSFLRVKKKEEKRPCCLGEQPSTPVGWARPRTRLDFCPSWIDFSWT